MTARISLILREARAHRARLQLLFRSEDQSRHRKPCGITLFRVRFSWASLCRWYALKNARVPPAIVLSRLRRGKNGQTPVAGFSPPFYHYLPAETERDCVCANSRAK